MAGTPKPIGRILIIPKGNYDPATPYNSLDLVRYDFKSWLCKTDGIIGITPTEGTDWTLMTEDGTDGTDGRGIVNIQRTGTDPSNPLKDIYTITYTDGTTSTFTVTNGSGGGTTADTMLKSVYDKDDDGIVDKADASNTATNATDATNAKNLKKSDGTTIDADTITTKLGKVDNKIDKPASATDGQVLTYNATSDEWEAQDSKGGGADTSIISDAYDELKSYVKGNYCIYDNALWKALGSSQGAMPTEGTLWTKVSVSEELDELNSSLTLDYSNASENVRDVNTLLQKLLNKFYTDFNEIIVGLSNFSVVSNSSNWVHLDKTFDISEFNGVVNISFTITSNNGRIYIYGIKNGVETALYSKEGFTGSVLVDEIIDASRYDSIKVKIGAFSTTTTITNVVCEAK